MSTSPSKPLLTFAIAALNQERFIREAVEAAFAQTYSPLEIVLSDDHSEDRTFEIMKEMAAAYRGPHKIILNQNPARRCIGGHINRIIEISNGELIIGAAGDDVSLPGRTQLAYETWEKSGRRATSIYSNFTQIDEAGRPIEQRYKTVPNIREKLVQQRTTAWDYVRTLQPVVFGCAHSFSRQLFQTFGSLPESLVHEDNVLGFRSVIAGEIHYINEPLVKYRLHGNNIYLSGDRRAVDLQSLEGQERRLRSYFRNKENMYAALLPDLDKAERARLLDANDLEKTRAEAVRMQKCFAAMASFLESGFISRCRIFLQVRRSGLVPGEMRGLAKRLLPRPLFLRIRLALAYIAALRQSNKLLLTPGL